MTTVARTFVFSRPIKTAHLCAVVAIFILVIATGRFAFSQEAKTPPKSSSSLARFVPASARLYVNVRKLADVDRAINRAHAWRFLPVLFGTSVSSDTPVDLRQAVSRFIGDKSSINIDDLMRTEIGIVIDSWPNLERAVWIARVADEATLDRWFPKNKRVEGKQPNGLRFLRSEEGVVAAYRDGVIIMSRHTGRPSLFRDAVSLMSGQRGDSLESHREYQSMLAYMPQRELSTIYWSGLKESGEPDNQLNLIPGASRAVIRMFEGDGRIELAVRATRIESLKQDEVSPDAVEKLVRLPQTTIFAACSRIDLAKTFAQASDATAGGWQKYLVLLDSILAPATTTTELFKQLGPHAIMAWEPDLRPNHSTPQAALMIQCQDTRAVSDAIDKSVANALKLVSAMTPAGPDQLTITETNRLGVTIHSVPLSSIADEANGPIFNLLGGAEPAWAFWDQWLIVAVHREQIERIIDSHYGLIPSLTALPDVLSMYKERADRAAVSIIQPGLVADVVDEWLKSYEVGAASLLDPAVWSSATRHEQSTAGQLGIGMKANQRPGMVVVARVYPDSTAADLLEPGDHIIGIDGHLLAMSGPNVDLRRRWLASTAEPGPTLRIIRGDETKEVVVKKTRTEGVLPQLAMKPTAALRELSEIGHTLQLTNFALNATDDRHYSAKLSLRFAPPPTTDNAATVGTQPSAKPNPPAKQERPANE